jgi:peptide methionine sulfoxide reductase msrA/msrB
MSTLRGLGFGVLALELTLISATFDGQTRASENAQEATVTYNKLTEAEERVILHKGTEPPFSGKFYEHHESGTYTCRQCGAPLFDSHDKFDSHCGWPSFDDEIPGAVKRTVDADGVRTEISCARCGGHLGHLFLGEGFTTKNARHCVNSLSLDFVAASAESTATAYFAGGCFWGTEHWMQKLDGVLSTRVGYMGGRTLDPSYETVCSGETGHAETVEVVFDPRKVTYETLARQFFEIHDPTQLNRQGPDVGDQYRSAVFYQDEAQRQVVERLLALLRENGYKVVTELAPAGPFYVAEKYHQDYYQTTGKTPYCHVYQMRF